MRRDRALLVATTALAAPLVWQSPALAQAKGAQVEELVVTGIRQSQAASIETKRTADAVVDAITAEDVGKFPDKNVAEALQRVPGIQINREFGEGERVSLRGTAPNLTRTLLNGHALATADWFILEQLASTRSFNFLMLPSEIIGQVKVFKSPTADMEEGGVGGTIDIDTRRPLDLKSMYFAGSLQGAYTENSDKWDPQASALFSWKNADETLGVMLAGIYQKRELRRDGLEVLGYQDNDPGAGVQLVPSLIGSALFQQERIRKGGNFAVQYRPNDAFELNLTGLYSKFGADNYNQNFLAWGSNALGGGGTLTNVTMQGDTAVAGRISSTPGGRGAVFDAIDRIASAQTRNIDLEARYHPGNDWDLHFRVGYTDADGDTESQPFVEFGAPATFDYDLRGGTPKVTFVNLDPTRPQDMVFDFASLHQVTNADQETYGYADAEKKVEWGAVTTIRFGLKATDHQRDTDFQATTYGSFFLPLLGQGCGGAACGPTNFAGPLTPGDYLSDIATAGVLRRYWQVDRGKLEQILFSQPASVRARVPNYPAIFSVEEKTLGGYLMAKFEGEAWRGNLGVRVVKTDQDSTGYTVDLAPGNNPGSEVSNAFGAFEHVSASRSYTDILPSVNLSFDLTPQIVLRFAAARTVARPDFTDVAPGVSLNPGSLTGSGGNPNIDPFRANQFDVSVEWYPNRETVVAAAFFYKDIQSFITDRPVTETFPIETTTPNLSRCTRIGTTGSLYNCQFDINRRANGGGGRIQGFELNLQAPLAYGFGVQTNYTYSDAQAQSGDPIPGNSKHTFNLVGYYENDKLSARLAYTYRSEFFITFDRASPLNQDGLSSLDASVSYNVTDNVALTFDAQNLTDENIEQYSGNTSRPRAIYDNGRVYYAGVRLKF